MIASNKELLKEKLKNREIKVEELTDEEVINLIEEFKKEIDENSKELEILNKKIKDIKIKIDNWNKD